MGSKVRRAHTTLTFPAFYVWVCATYMQISQYVHTCKLCEHTRQLQDRNLFSQQLKREQEWKFFSIYYKTHDRVVCVCFVNKTHLD